MSTRMLYEGEVIEILCAYLAKDGYEIKQKLKTTEKGVDIIAKKNGVTLFVEAKGETSSNKNSSRWGLPFTKNQVGTHISVAILKSLTLMAINQSNNIAIAFPDNLNHRQIIDSISAILKKTGIKIYMVSKELVREI